MKPAYAGSNPAAASIATFSLPPLPPEDAFVEGLRPEIRAAIATATPDRRNYLGSGDIAAIVDASPFSTRMDVFMKKTGLVPDAEETDAQKAGRHFEPGIAAWYAEETGGALVKATFVRHPTEPWAGATPDFYDQNDLDENHRGAIVECKLVGRWMEHIWEDSEPDPPQGVIAQVHWQGLCTGQRRLNVAAAIGGALRIFRVPWDEELAALLLAAGRRFWTLHVEARQPPPIDGSDAATRYLRARYPRASDLCKPATPEADEQAAIYLAAKNEMGPLEAVKEEAKNKLKQMIGDDLGIAGNSFVALWRPRKDGTRVFDCKERPETAARCSSPGR